MGAANEVMLANANIMCHFMFDVPPDPYYGRKSSGIIAVRKSR